MESDIYGILNYRLIDPASIEPIWYRRSYLIFNYIEAAIWFIIALYLPFRFRHDRALVLQMIALVAFGFSDLIECQGTTLLLLLYKGALLLALVQGRSLLTKRSVAQIDVLKPASPV